MQKFTYHGHTKWSDGTATIDEAIETAISKGFSEIGFSDHLVLHPSGEDFFFSIPNARLGEYVDEVRSHANRADINVRLGVEVDYLPSSYWEKKIKEVSDIYQFDYMICGVHFFDGKFNYGTYKWKEMEFSEVLNMQRKYWQNLRKGIETGIFDFAAHIDLPKIFNYQLESELSDEIDAVINALVKTGTAIEINTSGKDKCAEFFPSVKLIERCRDNGIKVLISDDAHHVNHIGRHFAEAEELLENLKYTNRWSL